MSEDETTRARVLCETMIEAARAIERDGDVIDPSWAIGWAEAIEAALTGVVKDRVGGSGAGKVQKGYEQTDD